MKLCSSSVAAQVNSQWGVPSHLCITVADRMALSKEAILASHSNFMSSQADHVRHIVDDAEDLAWQTGVPHLVFPVLAEEKLGRMTLADDGSLIDREDLEQSLAA